MLHARRGRLAAHCLALVACGGGASGGVTIAVDTAHPGAFVPDDFAGASYETSTLVGGAYFRADNAALVRMFGTLGVHHLRLGGNEADRGALPSDADVLAALAFADAVSVPVIYTLRLATYDPAAAAATAKLVLDHDAARVACFAVGNEPDFYTPTYGEYLADFDAYVGAIADARAYYCGPDVFAGGSEWPAKFAADRGDAIVVTTVHEYFGGNGTTCVASYARDRLLSAELDGEYATNRATFAQAAIDSGHGFRLSETNSYFNGGCVGASDAFASSLWGLDYLWWWATHDARGVDFHTGDHVSGTATIYSLFVTSPTGYHVRPLGYALAAFALGSRGHLAPVTIANAPPELAAYATTDDAGGAAITIIDKQHDASALPIAIELSLSHRATSALAWRLEAPAVDATDGVTLGGAAIADDGSWTGAPSPLAIDDTGGARVTIDPASAVVVELR